MLPNLKESAIFIADAHYNTNKQELIYLLEKINNKEIITSQIILMGDIFDFLSYEITYFKNKNIEVINLINKLSNSIEIIYLEGNHDFNLEKIFKNTLVIPRNKQIFKMNFEDKIICLAHGDIFTPSVYNIYTSIIRNTYVLKVLNSLDINNFISKRVDKWLISKDIAHIFKDFDSFAQNRINRYKDIECDLIIEGHFHQGKSFDKYINLPSLAVDNKYLQVINSKFTIL